MDKTIGACPAAAGSPPLKNKFVRWIKRDYGCYLFALPAIIGFFVFTFYPVIMSLFYSFTDYNGMFFTKIGAFNFAEIFDTGRMGRFHDVFGSFGVTFQWALISVPLGLVLSFLVALFVQRQIKGAGVFRLLYYIPTLIPGIAMSFIWLDVFRGNDHGLVNQLLLSLGAIREPLLFLDGESTAFLTLLITSLWGIGGNIIMWLAALRNVPPELYEAASLDGSGYFGKLFRITLPMCTPMIFFNLINALIAAMQAFDVYAMVGRGPNDCLYFISIQIYEKAFTGNPPQTGLACAMGWLLFVVIACLTAITFKTNRWVTYGEGD